MEKSEKCPTGEKLAKSSRLSAIGVGTESSISVKKPAVFKIKNRYYFKFSINGERKNVPTGKTTLEDAEKYRDEFLESDDAKEPRKLCTLLKLFSSSDTNPKYAEAQISGEPYTKRYAEMEASRVKHLLDLVPSDILNTKIKDITKKQCERVKAVLFKEYGNRSIGNDTFSTFKGILNYAYAKGYMPNMIAFRMKGIKVSSQKSKIKPFEDLIQISREASFFRNETEMDKFFILLTTGLRRAELSAIQGKQLKRAKLGDRTIYILDISQSFKDENQTEIGLPKWNIQRIIPLAESTGQRLWKYKKGDEDFLLKTGNSVWTDSFAYTKAIAGVTEDFSPHKLRHALNTKLIEIGVNPTLVQEYFGWHHQDRNRVQEGYTHIYIKALMEVADKIEELINGDYENEGLVWLD